jgi:hypothetical protein
MVFTEGVCFATTTLFFPSSVVDTSSPRTPMPVVVWYRGGNATAPEHPPPLAVNLTSRGYVVALPELCGFGQTAGSLRGPALSGRGMAAEDMAHEIGRSLPGFHAGEMVRVERYLKSRSDISSIALVLTEDHLDVAAMHAASHKLACSSRPLF